MIAKPSIKSAIVTRPAKYGGENCCEQRFFAFIPICYCPSLFLSWDVTCKESLVVPCGRLVTLVTVVIFLFNSILRLEFIIGM